MSRFLLLITHIVSYLYNEIISRSYSYVHPHLRLPNHSRNSKSFVPQSVSAALPNYVNGKDVKILDAKRPVLFLLESVQGSASCLGPRLPSLMVMIWMMGKNLRRLVKIFDVGHCSFCCNYIPVCGHQSAFSVNHYYYSP